jgi:oligoendopeptidase F
MYEDPLYLVNYLYAGLLATEMFDRVERDPSGFPKRYADLLRSFFGRSLSQEEMVDDCMNILKRRVDELAAAYGKIQVRAH